MKKLKNYVLTIFFFSFININAGCGLYLKIVRVGDPPGSASYGFYYSSSSNGSTTYTFNPNDSINLQVTGGGCFPYITKITCNNVLQPSTSRVKCTPGYYTVFAKSTTNYDISFLFYITNAIEVGIKEDGLMSSLVTFAPSPAKESVTINSSEENLKSVSIFNMNAQLLEYIETNANAITVPLNQYPQGIYIVKVATLSDKIAIKKLIVSN